MFERNVIGIIGIVIALTGIAIAVFQDEMRSPPAETSATLKSRVVEKSITLLGGEVDKPAEVDAITLTYRGLGFLAFLFGVVSWVRKENHRISALAGALGAVAVAWEYVVIGIGIAVVVLILGAFS